MIRHSASLNPALMALAVQQGGAFTRHQALQLGCHDPQLQALVESGLIVLATRGAYYLNPERDADWPALSSSERAGRTHALRAVAVLLILPKTLVASHETALLLHGLPRLGRSDGTCHVMAMTSSARTRRVRVRTHLHVPGTQLHAAAPRRVSVADAIAETTCMLGLEAGVVAGDAALHRQQVELASIEAACRRLQNRKGAAVLRQMVQMLDGRSESVGESQLRVICGIAGIRTTPQVRVADRGGPFARVDLAVDGLKLAVEFDGMVKYRDDHEALVREKRRQERLERAGWIVVRVTWEDLRNPAEVVRRVRAAMERAVAR